MNRKYHHSLLVVDDDETVGQVMIRIFGEMGIDVVYAPSGEIGVSKIERAPQPFSIIISDQRMPGMKGHEFLKYVFEMSPDSLRFLISGFDDMKDLAKAINQGHCHKIIKKPWDNHELISVVENSLIRYEFILEEKALFDMVLKQNKQLYKLKSELSAQIEAYKKPLAELDLSIENLKIKLNNYESGSNDILENEIETLSNMIFQKNRPSQDRLDSVYFYTFNELYDQLLSVKNIKNIDFENSEFWK